MDVVETCANSTPLWANAVIWGQIVVNILISAFNVWVAFRNRKAIRTMARIFNSQK